MKMRVYYIFLIKKEIAKISKDKELNLFKFFESIYNLKKEDAILGFKMFDKVCKRIERRNITKMIKDKYLDDLTYTIIGNTHVINDFLNNETTKLEVNNSHIKIKSNSMYPTFFKDLAKYDNLFVCDFDNMDYFFLKDAVVKVNS